MSGWSWRFSTPARPGAVAILELWGAVEQAFAALGIANVEAGRVNLRPIADIDSALIARLTTSYAQVMPHGGPAVVRAIADRLRLAHPDSPDSPRPEADSALESAMLDALASAASPAAIDLLLLQPSRWMARLPRPLPDRLPEGEAQPEDLILRRLIHPPLVVAWGAANIGKSSLCNALAGREAAIVADEPGTTRDHVGVLLDLDGLTVRYLDTPGVRTTTDELEREAAAQASLLAAQADLLLLCGDPATTPPPPPPSPTPPLSLSVLLRADLAPATWTPDIATSSKSGTGLVELARAIRERLVPTDVYRANRPWRFWNHPNQTLPVRNQADHPRPS